jgi:NAD(P)-dependent dehydrogenase (short-subunit alcohol dehydrogenase family)
VGRYDLGGRVAVVTGASVGLGEEFCHGLAESGANVVLAARRLDRIERIAGALESRYGVRALPIRTDVTSESDVAALITTAVRELGALDVLVNNAGLSVVRPLLEHSLEDWQQVIDVNLTAVFVASREAGRVMVPRRSGSIINISSVFGFQATRRFPVIGYYASKSGVTGLTVALAVELGKHNVRVNAIAPTFFPTEMSQAMFADTVAAERLRQEVLWPKTALPELARPEWIRGAACFLASDDSRYVTGQTLAVDGGWLAL